MKYRRPSLEKQLALATHPEVRKLLLDFDGFSRRARLPEPTLVCLGRTTQENRLVGGVPTSLHLWEPPFANGTGKEPETRAADLSVKAYDESQMELVLTWFRGEVAQRGGKARWELISEPHGTGPHIHVGVKREKPAPEKA